MAKLTPKSPRYGGPGSFHWLDVTERGPRGTALDWGLRRQGPGSSAPCLAWISPAPRRRQGPWGGWLEWSRAQINLWNWIS